MIKKRYLVALGAFSGAIAACGADIGAPQGSGAASGAVGGSAPTGGTGTGGASGGSAPTGGTGTGGASGGTATGGTGTGGTSTGGTGTGGTGTGGSAGAGASSDGPPVCAPGIPVSSQVPRMLNRQYDAVMKELLGVATAPSAGLYADYDGPMNADAWRLYQDVATKIAADTMAGANKAKFIACDPAMAQCLTDTIKAFGRKAFRRPLTDAEVTSFQRLTTVTPAGTAAQVAESILYTFLVSPSFIMIPELAQTKDTASGAIALSSYEVAARLSFLLWGSIPDDTLAAAADANMLTTKEQILAQAQRMMGIREKAAPMVAAFHEHYLDMDNDNSHWWKIDHDATKFPLYASTDKPLLRAELDSFFQEIAFNSGTFKDLFLSNIGFVNNATAPLYGLSASAYGADLTKVELDATTRPGFLTRTGFLSSFAHNDATSPILRGAFITVNVIGVNPGAPDPNAFLTAAPPGDYKTERQYVAALTGQTACRGCHIDFINPPGYVLENFDAVGSWQTVDQRAMGDASVGTIDATADITIDNAGTKVSITNPLQMMQEIAKAPAAKGIYAQKWVHFATGRDANPNDQCTVDDLDMKLSNDGYTILNMLTDLTQSDSFRLRVKGS